MKYEVGTMIEIPRAALTADEIANEAEFFSFGTNDLTQMTFGFSRDDAGKFLELLLRQEDLRVRSLRPPGPERRGQAGGDGREAGPPDQPGHRAWASAASTAATRPRVEFCHNVGLDYVSCSPFRVPIARLAAAQAAIREETDPRRSRAWDDRSMTNPGHTGFQSCARGLHFHMFDRPCLAAYNDSKLIARSITNCATGGSGYARDEKEMFSSIYAGHGQSG